MKMVKTFSRFLAICFVFFVISCENEQQQTALNDVIQLEITKSEQSVDSIEKIQNWHVSDKKICVLFGYGFNDEKTLSQLLNGLENKYGLNEEGGVISPLIYPDSFRHGARGFISDFVQEIESDDRIFSALIVLGAPERTHISLARNQDYWKQQVPYPVVALFPQDDVLGIESTCDIVLDKSQLVDLTGDVNDENLHEYDVAEIQEILFNAIDYLLCVNGTFEKDVNLQKHMAQMVKNRKFYRYTDPETGLQSINHFVLY